MHQGCLSKNGADPPEAPEIKAWLEKTGLEEVQDRKAIHAAT